MLRRLPSAASPIFKWRVATLRDAQSEPRPGPGFPEGVQHVWGPISPDESKAAGAIFPTASVLLRPNVDEGVVRAALGEIPKDLFPTDGDTPASLRDRLAASTWLEDSRVLKGGKGPTKVNMVE